MKILSQRKLEDIQQADAVINVICRDTVLPSYALVKKGGVLSMSDDRVALVTGAKARLLVGSLSIVTKRRDECPVVSNCKDGEMVKGMERPTRVSEPVQALS
jgi:hypothetical protein